MSETKRRLFFGLWPDPDLREQLAIAARAAQRHTGGRPVPAHNLHLTLAFLGNLTTGCAECVTGAAADIAVEPFALRFDRIGWWRRPGILWLAPAAWPAQIEGLAAVLWQVLAPCGIEPETRPFKPHVTVARRCGRARTGPMTPIDWPVSDFVLIESLAGQTGSRYQVLKRWPLAIEPGASQTGN